MNHKDIALAIAPVLNHLLHASPFDTGHGLDFGWFCREHALATKLIFNKLGIDCDIVRGHVAAYVAGEKRLATGAGADHDWCVTNELVPCDLSITFRHFTGFRGLETPILGPPERGSFTIEYVKDVAQFPSVMQPDACALFFAPTSTFRLTLSQCLSNPRSLRMGKEPHRIALASAAHCLDAMRSPANAIPLDLPQHVALTEVLKRFREPRDYLSA
jgi:hypothetical protein